MFYEQQTKEEQQEYIKKLQIVGSLSNLFSQSNVPYLYYRVAEKVFCKAFGAKDLSRGDVALDAYKDGVGIGLKTFLANNNRTFQKVAEFNKDKILYENKAPKKLVEKIAELRNKRIEFAQNLYGIKDSLYHCVVRDSGVFKVYEESMNFVDIANITDVQKKKNSIFFHDTYHEYTFNLSKSTLLKRFVSDSFQVEFDVKILENPFEELHNCFSKQEETNGNYIVDTVFLPLYSNGKVVSPKSGLNQWNAGGRKRNSDEVYIPIPAKVRTIRADFFPHRDHSFNLILPDGRILQSKVCQDSSKALMSFSNKELGKWILRDVLHLEEGKLLTYEMLQELGIDSVKIDKYSNGSYKINFAQIDSYENFILNYL